MKPTATTLPARLYDGIHAVEQTATLLFSGPMVNVISRQIAKQYNATHVRVSPRIGAADRFVTLPDGIQLQCPDHPLLNRLAQEGRTEGVVAWLERRWWVALAGLTATVAACLYGYFVGLPLAAERISQKIPIEYEVRLGEESLAFLDNREVFRPSTLLPEPREYLTRRFRELHRGLPHDRYYRLEFRSAPGLGPNAFALPGGIVVITDQMIAQTHSPDEALAVLAHEIGHVERRHVLRHILQDSVVATAAATISGDASSLSLAVSGLPVLLAKAKYSREFEEEADLFAFELLKRNRLSSEAFASLMERLAGERKQHERAWSFLSTHPVTADRIKRARDAAQD